MFTTIRVPQLSLCLLLCACTDQAPLPHTHEGEGNAHESEGDPDGHAHASGDRIHISPATRSNLGISFTAVEVRRVTQTLRIPGVFEIRPRARREYRLPLPGRVELLVEHLDAIREGDPLYRYQSPKWPELLHEIILGEQEMDIAAARITVADATLQETHDTNALLVARIESLLAAGASDAALNFQASQLAASIPRLTAELELARTQHANAVRTRKHAIHRAAIAAGLPESDLVAEVSVRGATQPAYTKIDWITVRASAAGLVDALYLTSGAFAESPSLVLTTADPTDLRLRARAMQSDLPLIQALSTGNIVPTTSRERAATDAIPAVLQLGLEAHPSERSTTLFATPDSLAPWIRPGISAFLELEADPGAAPTLAIPNSAILRDGLDHIFFRLDPNDPDQVIRVVADAGATDGQWTEILSGLQRGDSVVQAGAYELKLGLNLDTSPQAGGHIHADGSVH